MKTYYVTSELQPDMHGDLSVGYLDRWRDDADLQAFDTLDEAYALAKAHTQAYLILPSPYIVNGESFRSYRITGISGYSGCYVFDGFRLDPRYSGYISSDSQPDILAVDAESADLALAKVRELVASRRSNRSE